MEKPVLLCALRLEYDNCDVPVTELKNRLKRSMAFLENEGLFTGSLDVELVKYDFQIIYEGEVKNG